MFLEKNPLFSVGQYKRFCTRLYKSYSPTYLMLIVHNYYSPGIGFYTAMDFARRNARVILACRDVRKGEQASIKITMETGNMNIVVMQVDLSLMKSVRSFVKKFLEQETQLDILVNNAGVAGRDMGVKAIIAKYKYMYNNLDKPCMFFLILL